MESINPITNNKFLNNEEFKKLVSALDASKIRIDKQNKYLRLKLGVEDETNKEILNKTKALCKGILNDDELPKF